MWCHPYCGVKHVARRAPLSMTVRDRATSLAPAQSSLQQQRPLESSCGKRVTFPDCWVCKPKNRFFCEIQEKLSLASPLAFWHGGSAHHHSHTHSNMNTATTPEYNTSTDMSGNKSPKLVACFVFFNLYFTGISLEIKYIFRERPGQEALAHTKTTMDLLL